MKCPTFRKTQFFLCHFVIEIQPRSPRLSQNSSHPYLIRIWVTAEKDKHTGLNAHQASVRKYGGFSIDSH